MFTVCFHACSPTCCPSVCPRSMPELVATAVSGGRRRTPATPVHVVFGVACYTSLASCGLQPSGGGGGRPRRLCTRWQPFSVACCYLVQEEDVHDAFAEFGDVKNIYLNLDRRTGGLGWEGMHSGLGGCVGLGWDGRLLGWGGQAGGRVGARLAPWASRLWAGVGWQAEQKAEQATHPWPWCPFRSTHHPHMHHAPCRLCEGVCPRGVCHAAGGAGAVDVRSGGGRG